MVQYAEPIERLIQAFSRLPGVGEKSATRLALFILNSKSGYVEELVESLDTLKERVKLCGTCMAFSATDPCPTCTDHSRNHAVICVVSDFKDMMALDSAGGFSGSYHILHGNLAPLKGVGPDELRINELVSRVEAGGVEEVILATGFDSEGEATALYLTRTLKAYGVKLTRLASGVPVGSYVEYMDGVTLGRAMDGRRVV